MDNLRCGRQCDVINRPSYIVLFKGDDSDFEGNQSVDIVINTELDTTGMKAHFRFMDFVQDFNSIPENKILSLVFPNAKTSEFPLGAADATLRFEDASGKFRTISNRIHIVVTNSVHEAYDNEDSQSITVTVKGTVTWEMIQNKPEIPTPQDIPQPSNSDPLMDGDASAGVSDEYARGDHRHPSDDSKRGVTDLGVRGAPEGEGSWFTLNGDRLNFNDGVWGDHSSYKYIDTDGIRYQLFYSESEPPVEFSLDQDYTSTIGEYTVIGYVDTLASEGYVNSAVATNTANFLGTFDYVDDLHFAPPASSSDVSNSSIATALLSVVASPSNNDYVFVKIDYTSTTPEDEFRRFKFDGASSVWRYEYTLNSASFTPAQWAAINSGITANKVEQIDGKLDGAAAYLMWSSAGSPYAKDVVVFRDGYLFRSLIDNNSSTPDDTSADWGMVTLDELKQDALTFDSSPTQNSNNPVKSGGVYTALQAKANATDLPYAMVTPGEWAFSGMLSGDAVSSFEYTNGDWEIVTSNGDEGFVSGGQNDLRVEIVIQGSYTITATRPSLPGHLLDRAGNRVVVSGDTTLTLPAAIPGYIRDFLVRLEISGSTVPTITFAAPTGETIVYETDGDEFPVPDEAGTWSYSFTENCVAHKFAVSLKKVNTVAQGGS